MIRQKALFGQTAYAIGKDLGISKNTAKKYIEDVPKEHGHFQFIPIKNRLFMLSFMHIGGDISCRMLRKAKKIKKARAWQAMPTMLLGTKLLMAN